MALTHSDINFEKPLQVSKVAAYIEQEVGECHVRTLGDRGNPILHSTSSINNAFEGQEKIYGSDELRTTRKDCDTYRFNAFYAYNGQMFYVVASSFGSYTDYQHKLYFPKSRFSFEEVEMCLAMILKKMNEDTQDPKDGKIHHYTEELQAYDELRGTELKSDYRLKGWLKYRHIRSESDYGFIRTKFDINEFASNVRPAPFTMKDKKSSDPNTHVNNDRTYKTYEAEVNGLGFYLIEEYEVNKPDQVHEVTVFVTSEHESNGAKRKKQAKLIRTMINDFALKVNRVAPEVIETQKTTDAFKTEFKVGDTVMFSKGNIAVSEGEVMKISVSATNEDMVYLDIKCRKTNQINNRRNLEVIKK